MELLREQPPQRLCEIGTNRGGTLALFAHVAAVDAAILSIDLRVDAHRIQAYRHLTQPSQRVTCLGADSHSEETLNKVRQWLDGDQIDVLFIDGDHSLLGVATDYELYAPLVRDGGLICAARHRP